MRRYRRRNRGVWLPTTVTTIPVLLTATGPNWDNGVASEFSSFIFNNDDAGGASALAAYTPLAGVIGPGSSLLIKRIVGDIDISAYQVAGDDSHGFAAFGIFVDRTDAVGNLANINAWQMFGNSGTLPQQTAAAMQKRWMFRRFWHLGNASGLATSGADQVTPPYTASWHGGGLYSSGHIDCKVKARVSVEERLWYTFQVTGASIGCAPGTHFSAQFTQNMRIFATPTTYRNR